eukprot:CAMPEP_0178443070 /NCGR_PEP_ID=MMETSP0689_2-20121128/38610_1 /TAXON_ID=160604 /ORGANISM="Amphidinium massartii, Strain CS-259" /LENGTH=171 /DNA_ID=CAMNT_0020066875 /DNA_START=20 /DNA_END=532 /DNA_ORIENTATION=+
MASTIEIKSGVPESCTRMVLKREMERFGQVDVCHMGNRQDPTNEPPWVRFANAKSADSALTAIQAGEVFIDGIVIAADRSNKRGPPLVSREPRDAEIGSRELFLKGGAAGGKGKGKGGKGAAVVQVGIGIHLGAVTIVGSGAEVAAAAADVAGTGAEEAAVVVAGDVTSER